MREAHDITRLSPIDGVKRTVTLVFDMEDYKKWNNGMNIQQAMPYLSPSEREFMMTGITSEQWDELFKGEDE